MAAADAMVELLLGAPLFLFALVVANVQWAQRPRIVGQDRGQEPPPKIQSLRGYVGYNCRSTSEGARRTRKRHAKTVAKLSAQAFMACGVVAPAGLCVDAELPSRVDKMCAWIANLYALDPAEALCMLAANAHIVPDSVWRAVETEYNDGITRAARVMPNLALLKLDEDRLVVNLADMESKLSALPPTVRALEMQGAFYRVLQGFDNEETGERQVRSLAADHSTALVLVYGYLY